MDASKLVQGLRFREFRALGLNGFWRRVQGLGWEELDFNYVWLSGWLRNG